MAKIIGYILALIGLFLLVVNLKILNLNIPLLSSINPTYLLIAGAILVILGVVFMSKSGTGKTKQEEEVPIYEGTGKKRKIIGYRKEK